MIFLGIGIVLLALKWLEIGPVAQWSWLVVLAPFALAAAWWVYSDWSGLTARRQAERDEARKKARVDKQRDMLRNGRRR
ncbi:TIGR04438 family Trp-rich protein [Xylophilus rhododendri]|uniref:TIGR04438 family Trp-rich protein n=1 Tax=Xylophilus rhododendri TaxID=2697032 RepID=A0A857JC76_9BURK|nr:TIGR04438 family Trp-rich protein [Xylophilus rhododendri]QHJ00700.1 TIGR04438 family Trp-rich protein [Xylophilus rhododendri]